MNGPGMLDAAMLLALAQHALQSEGSTAKESRLLGEGNTQISGMLPSQPSSLSWMDEIPHPQAFI